MPAEMTLRDHFAAAALTGLLAQGDDGSFSEEWYARSAYRWADAMLRCRAGGDCPGQDNAPNLDAAPAAIADLPDERPPNAVSANGGTPCAASRDGSGTGNTPVTEPMPKGKRAEVSDGWRSDIRPPDAADRAAAAACDRAWGITPVAWVVMDGEEAMEFCTDEEEAKGAAVHYGVTNIVPLYRKPRPTLTDAEREAVEWASKKMRLLGDAYDPERAATLRGLLERLK